MGIGDFMIEGVVYFYGVCVDVGVFYCVLYIVFV